MKPLQPVDGRKAGFGIVEAGLMDEKRLIELKNEANEIISMVVASIKTARSRK